MFTITGIGMPCIVRDSLAGFGNRVIFSSSSLHKFPGRRCYMLPMNILNGGNKGAYVFIMHPEEKDKVCLITETGIFQEEKHFLSSALMFRKSEAKKYNLLFNN
ncbi:hypothetical protein OAK67_02615 [Crocinitomicaceae bacterium]|nr:hypothetical protein [Crocinitomicaceae bacterium]